MSEYYEMHSRKIKEEVTEKCFEARCKADWWASEHPNATPKEVIAEGERRYYSFYERAHFILEAAEVIEIIKRKSGKTIHNDILRQHDEVLEGEVRPSGTE